MHELRVSSLATHPTFLSSILKRVHDTADSYFPREAIVELEAAKKDDKDETDYGFDERIRVNEIGRLLEGQQNHVCRISEVTVVVALPNSDSVL